MVTQRDIDAWTLHDLRYSLGRMTGAPDECAQRVRLYWHRVSPNMRAILIRDCAEHIDRIARLERGELDDFDDTQRRYNARVWSPLLVYMRGNVELPHCCPEADADAMERERAAYDAYAEQVSTFVDAVADLVTDASGLMHDDDAADVLARFDALKKP